MANVEIQCKTMLKTQCKLLVKHCGFFKPSTTLCVKQSFPTAFLKLSHHVFNSRFTSVFQLFYPLFHNPYYYNYINLYNRKERKN